MSNPPWPVAGPHVKVQFARTCTAFYFRAATHNYDLSNPIYQQFLRMLKELPCSSQWTAMKSFYIHVSTITTHQIKYSPTMHKITNVIHSIPYPFLVYRRVLLFYQLDLFVLSLVYIFCQVQGFQIFQCVHIKRSLAYIYIDFVHG